MAGLVMLAFLALGVLVDPRLLVVAGVIFAVKFAPGIFRRLRADYLEARRTEQPAERRAFAADLPASFEDGMDPMVKAWTSIASLVEPGKEVELRYFAEGLEHGGVVAQVVFACDPALERRVKDALRRAFEGQVSFRQVSPDPFTELHEQLNAQRHKEPEATTAA